MISTFSSLNRKQYRKVIIADSRNLFSVNSGTYNPFLDLVLTFDFALKKDVESIGGIAFYLDHLCDQDLMQKNNFLMYQFFKDWHYDRNGQDIFNHKNINYGISFRIEICQDFIYYGRLRICLGQIKKITFQTLEIYTENKVILSILGDMQQEYIRADTSLRTSLSPYFFPIGDWIEMRLREKSVRKVLRDILMSTHGTLMTLIDLFLDIFYPTKKIFIQEYIPTRDILKKLQKIPGIRVIQAHYSAPFSLKKLFYERLVPTHSRLLGYARLTQQIIRDFRDRRTAQLVLSEGNDITSEIYLVIERQIISSLPRILRDLESANRYLSIHQLQLVVLIGNMGQLAMLVDCVAKSKGIKSYLIINGLLGNDYMDEGKYATFINSYSTSIRDNYFRGMDNIYCLGDPRMDEYALAQRRVVERIQPTITIGAAGFNSIDLNSYVAFEFDFLYEVLSAIQNVINCRKITIKLNIKVRSNGYIEQYKSFVSEYFPLLNNINFVDFMPMKSVLQSTDFYISFYSQTLLEASALGIPVVYYRKDNEIMNAPFDGKSELVTVNNIKELEQAVEDFLEDDDRYKEFLKKEVIEKYVGKLDGMSLMRNFNFICEMLSN